MSVQVIMKDGRPEWAVVPYHEYEALLKAAGVKVGLDSSEKVEPDNNAVSEPTQPSPPVSESVSEQMQELAQVVESGAFSGAKCRQEREKRGLDAATLAREVGVSPSYLLQMEQGDRAPSEPILRNLARALDISPTELL